MKEIAENDCGLFIYSTSDCVSNATKALDCWDQHQSYTILVNRIGSYAVVQDHMIFALYGLGKRNAAGWCQTSPEEIDTLIVGANM